MRPTAFAFALLSGLACMSCQAVEVARLSADGGGCGSAPSAAADKTDAASPSSSAAETGPGAAAPDGKPAAARVRPLGATEARPRAGFRWHSFLPGMIK